MRQVVAGTLGDSSLNPSPGTFNLGNLPAGGYNINTPYAYYTVTISSVPEPSTFVLLGVGGTPSPQFLGEGRARTVTQDHPGKHRGTSVGVSFSVGGRRPLPTCRERTTGCFQRPVRARWAEGELGGRGRRSENRRTPGAFLPSGFCWIKSGDTYSRTFGTTIGSESLTTVFGMGTGVTFQT